MAPAPQMNRSKQFKKMKNKSNGGMARQRRSDKKIQVQQTNAVEMPDEQQQKLSKTKMCNADDKRDGHDDVVSCDKDESLEKQMYSIAARLDDASKPEIQLEAAQKIRNLIMLHLENMSSEMLDNTDGKIVAKLIKCIAKECNPSLQFEAVWSLGNIASGVSNNVKLLVASGVLPNLLELITNYSNSMEVCEYAVWTLGNIVGDCAEMRDAAIEAGAVEVLLKLPKHKLPLEIQRNIVWALANILCHKKGKLCPKNISKKILSTFDSFIRHSDPEILHTTICALTFLSVPKTRRHHLIFISWNIIRELIQLLSHKNIKVLKGVINLVANMVAVGNTQLLIRNDVLSRIPPLLEHRNRFVRDNAIRFLTNIVSGNKKHLQKVINAGMLERIIDLLDEASVEKRIAFAVGQILRTANMEQVKLFVDKGGITGFCRLLKSRDDEVLYSVLNGLNKMLAKVDHTNSSLTDDIKTDATMTRLKVLRNSSMSQIRRLAGFVIKQLNEKEPDEENLDSDSADADDTE